MRQLLVGHSIGRLALATRAKLEIFRSALFEPESLGMIANDQLATKIITRLCAPGSFFIDIGAHIGSVVSEVRHHNKEARIIAVEAVPEKAENLRRRFRNVEVFSCALGESDGEVPFFVNDKRSGYSSLKRRLEFQDELREVKVLMRRLDDVAPSSEVDAIKIDVEGAELEVIRGGRQVLGGSRPTVLFESAPGWSPQESSAREQLWWEFAHLEYVVVLPQHVAHNHDGLSLKGFLESHVHPRRTTNYFAIAKERRLEVRDRARPIVGVKTA
ncbi:MAG: FkbM family methyltransferase [Myxococcota bacterium]